MRHLKIKNSDQLNNVLFNKHTSICIPKLQTFFICLFLSIFMDILQKVVVELSWRDFFFFLSSYFPDTGLSPETFKSSLALCFLF